jgi:L-cysteine/cystine lyase
MTFEEVRARFPVLERYAYLNAGTFGPLARATLDAVQSEQRRDGEDGRGGGAYFERMLGLRQSVRAKLAAQIGVPAENVSLTGSTTDGCGIVLRGLDLGPDDEVVTTDLEHFGLIGPLLASGARIRVARLAGRPPEAASDLIRAEVTPRTRLLALSHVVWLTGHRLPVAELRAATGLPVLVDGAQSAGAIPVDATAVDFYTVSAQKWLCGPDSTGALYVREPEELRVTAPSYFAQERYDLAEPSWEPRPGAARFDPGWLPTPSLAGLDAALDDLPDWRFERAAGQAARCRELLADAGFEVVTEPGHATLVSFRVPGSPADLVASCYKAGVVRRDMPGTDMLRASCGYWTSDGDLERLVAALRSS